jgi:hypothetical protein
LGYFLGGETVGLRTICGTGLVLVSVVVITTAKKPKTALADEIAGPIQWRSSRS